jgi:uncharacterized glyoxalase superfamily protein PhnB
MAASKKTSTKLAKPVKGKTAVKPKAKAGAAKTKKSKPTPVPAGYNTLTPHLTVKGAARAIEFYKNAFGAKEKHRMPGPDGVSVMHASLQIGNSMVMLNDEFPEMGSVSPSTLKGTPVTVHVYVKNADAVYEKAVRAGANAILPIHDAFWGDRYAVVQDPFGHQWSIASRNEIVSPKNMAKRMMEMMQRAPETADSVA